MKRDEILKELKRLIPIWQKEEKAELLKVAQKDYPGAKTLDEVVQRTTGEQLQDLSYHAQSLFRWIKGKPPLIQNPCLLPKTRKKFKPTKPEDFATLEILTDDAVQRHNPRSRKGPKQSWMEIKEHHCRTVKAVYTIRIFLKTLNFILPQEIYGYKIVRILDDDKDARKQLERMLKKYWPARSARIAKGGSEELAETLQDETIPEIHTCIAESINSSRKNAPHLKDFLPPGLPQKTRIGMENLLEGQNTETAKIFSDALAGKFRALPNELQKIIPIG